MIDDPLYSLYGKVPPAEETVKNPHTGIRESKDILQRQQNRDDEIKRKQAVKRRVIIQLMQDDMGREWLFDVLQSTGVFTNPFNSDTKLQDFNSGAFHVGLTLQNQLKQHALREYMQMCLEGWEREDMWADLAADK